MYIYLRAPSRHFVSPGEFTEYDLTEWKLELPTQLAWPPPTRSHLHFEWSQMHFYLTFRLMFTVVGRMDGASSKQLARAA